MALPDLLVSLTTLADPAPDPEDVTAGWTALVVFLLLIAAVVFLGFSLVKQLRKAQAAKDAGVYGDEPVQRSEEPDAADAPGTPGDSPTTGTSATTDER
jgi:hypothetical protein